MTKTIEALVEAALKRAFVLGQTYWQQADSDFTSHHKKAEATRQNFLVVCEETLVALAQARADQSEPLGHLHVRGVLHYYHPADPAFNLPDGKHAIFTTPPAAPVAKLEPLSAAEIRALLPLGGRWLDFARAVEAAHNAKLEPCATCESLARAVMLDQTGRA